MLKKLSAKDPRTYYYHWPRNDASLQSWVESAGYMSWVSKGGLELLGICIFFYYYYRICQLLNIVLNLKAKM